MHIYKAPLRDIDFVINEVLDYGAHYEKLPRGEGLTPDLVTAIVNEAAKFAENILSPLNPVGDKEGCHFENGSVSTPKGFRQAFDQFVSGGWSSLAQPLAYGGQGLPNSLWIIIVELLTSANQAWTMYPCLITGAIATIFHHGTEEQKEIFLRPMVQGIWGATMCLTEAHCGSDLGLLKTKAISNPDGSYRISGSKIFISGGDQDLTENIIHLCLARLPDAPAGSGGISLFIVPKILVNKDSTLGERNKVTCGAIEHKMGINGNGTCVLNFEGATGYLIGPANQGLRCMFTFINESRLGVSQQALGQIELSFQGALAYAKERLQMRANKRPDKSKPADPIIAHPDVRRMLLTQKSFSEGGRLLSSYCGLLVDLVHNNEDSEASRRADQLLSLLTPIAKGFLSEVGIEAANCGIQIFGGHGYIKEYGMEQIVRDVRITAIYEGTTGIQSLDLLHRKILATGGQGLQPLIDEIIVVCDKADALPELSSMSAYLSKVVSDWQKVTDEVGETALQDLDAIGASSYDYLMLSGYIVLGWLWLKAALVAANALDENKGHSEFYRAKLHTAQFYFERVLPRTLFFMETIRTNSANLMQIDDKAFAF